MKLLLTSNGFVQKSWKVNEAIKQEFLDMLEKPLKDLCVAFIPTAKMYEDADKRMYLRVMKFFDELKVKKIDFVEIAGLPHNNWLKRLQDADVIFIGGGNTYWLLHCVRESGLDKELAKLLEKRLYIGESAGSILVTPTINVASIEPADDNSIGLEDMTGLGLVDFEVSVHTPEEVQPVENEKYAKTISRKLYAINNNMAVKVDNNKIELVGEGQHWEYN